ncbi:hypothetical protein RB195_011343 [Necator americanus]|uniref:Uncharacterized protein n=1 Tax=Necator americanus TaxID=51031 RepID=A0ABR1D1Y5_NECAM
MPRKAELGGSDTIDSFQRQSLDQSSKLLDTTIKRPAGSPSTRWSSPFTKYFKEKYDAHRVPREKRFHWATLAYDRDK